MVLQKFLWSCLRLPNQGFIEMPTVPRMFIPQLMEICRKILANILLEKMLPYLSPSKKPENVCENWWGGSFIPKYGTNWGEMIKMWLFVPKKGKLLNFGSIVPLEGIKMRK